MRSSRRRTISGVNMAAEVFVVVLGRGWRKVMACQPLDPWWARTIRSGWSLGIGHHGSSDLDRRGASRLAFISFGPLDLDLMTMLAYQFGRDCFDLCGRIMIGRLSLPDTPSARPIYIRALRENGKPTRYPVDCSLSLRIFAQRPQSSLIIEAQSREMENQRN
jgi:hypothetical protein